MKLRVSAVVYGLPGIVVFQLLHLSIIASRIVLSSTDEETVQLKTSVRKAPPARKQSTHGTNIRRPASGSSSSPPTTLVDVPPECTGKEPLLKTIRLVRGGIQPDEDKICERLPLWANVTELYGAEPLVYGSSTCGTYQRLLNGAHPEVRVAGTFNSGIDLLSRLLRLNLIHENATTHENPFREVPWGRHTPTGRRKSVTMPADKGVQGSHVLPVVVVRDPYRWLQSMCNYAHSDVSWARNKYHCPNLVPTWQDNLLQGKATIAVTNSSSVPVRVKYPFVDPDTVPTFLGLDDVFAVFYNSYVVGSDLPFLLVRYEDILLHPAEVLDYVADCSGLKRRKRFRSFDDASGNDAWSVYLDSLVDSTQPTGRFDGMTDDDLKHVTDTIPADLLIPLHYTTPSEGYVSPPLKYPPVTFAEE